MATLVLSMKRIESLTIFATRSSPERGCYCSANYDYAISFNIEPKKGSAATTCNVLDTFCIFRELFAALIREGLP